MLKDKKIIIHKTDGKTFIPVTGRSYRTNSSTWIPHRFSSSHLCAVLAAIFLSSVKGKEKKKKKKTDFPQRTLRLNISASFPVGGCRKNLQLHCPSFPPRNIPNSSLINPVLICKLKEACSLSHHLHPEMSIPEQNTF